MEKSLMTFLLLFNDLIFGKSSLFAVMVTGMQFLKKDMNLKKNI